MTDLVLGPLFTEYLHPQEWCSYGALRGTPGCPRYEYRVTNPYTGLDLVNGGQHRAVDAGNAAKGWPVLMPARKRVRALHHFDGALGIEVELGGDYALLAWHLDDVLLPMPPAPTEFTGPGATTRGPWRDRDRGAPIGATGNSGGKTASGGTMPAHTHIELLFHGVRLDPEPHLFGEPIPGAPDDMPIFSDVPDDHRFSDDIEWLYEQGLTHGVAGTDPLEYQPEGIVTRGQMAAFLHRFARTFDLE